MKINEIIFNRLIVPGFACTYVHVYLYMRFGAYVSVHACMYVCTVPIIKKIDASVRSSVRFSPVVYVWAPDETPVSSSRAFTFH